jgi:hypothetical protein
VWSFGRRGQEQHDREEGDKEAEQLKNNLKKERQRGRITTRRDSLPLEPLQTNNGGRGLMSLSCALSCTKGLLPSLGFFVLFLF